jgi:hypothetical protein
MFTGFYRSGNYICGLEGYTGFQISDDSICGPDGGTHYYLREGDIFGPKGFTGYYFSGDNLYGPSSAVPWGLLANSKAVRTSVRRRPAEEHESRTQRSSAE